MKTAKYLLLGVLLSCTVLQLVHAKAWDDSFSDESEQKSQEDEKTDHDDHGADEHDGHSGHSGHSGHTEEEPKETARQAAAPVPLGAGAPTSSDTVDANINTDAKATGGVSGHNETCGSGSGRICNSNKSLECLSTNSTCQCKDGTVYIPFKEGCLPVDREGKVTLMKFRCEDTRQCQAGKWGTFSICEDGKCRCNANAHWVEDKCYKKANIGDYCDHHKECRASMNGTECRPLESSSMGSNACHCLPKHILDTVLNECVEVPEPNKANKFPCKSNLQCTQSSLGDLSRCGNGKCECFNHVNPGDNSIILYENTCFARRQINDTCTSHKECEASHHNAVCLEHEAYMRQTVCQCPEGKTCKQRNGSMGIFDSGLSKSSAVCIAVASVVVGRMAVGSTSVI